MTTLSGPQYYPGANRTAYWYEDNFGGTAMEVNVAGLHTTEGTSVPTYADSRGNRGASAPNFTVLPDFKGKRLNWYQHYRVDISSRALANRYGGVPTNTCNIVQVELVGTCDPKTRDKWKSRGLVQDRDFIFWPDAPDWALDDVADFLAWLHEEHGVPLTAPAKWPAYPTSYANGGGQRMTFDQWRKFKGVCGHMHVPENDHGDPGNIKIAWLLELAKRKLGVDDDKPNGPAAPPATNKPPIPAFPGRKYFAPGAVNKHVTALGKELKEKGFSRYHDGDGYQPGPRWTDFDRKNVAAFQRSRKELRGDADGYPGPLTWKLLFS